MLKSQFCHHSGSSAWSETLAERTDGKLAFTALGDGFGTARLGDGFDIVISAVGWTYDAEPLRQLAPVMEEGSLSDRYPKLTASYRSENVPGLYFAGTLAHGMHRGSVLGAKPRLGSVPEGMLCLMRDALREVVAGVGTHATASAEISLQSHRNPVAISPRSR